MGHSLTLRTTEDLLRRLERRARQVRVPKSALAGRYLEEGLTMDSIPGIVFRDGPAGRRAGLVGGPDVWEVIEVLRAESGDIQTTADTLGIRPGLVDAAKAYYEANADVTESWIESNATLMEQARQPVRRPT
jgi:hypothetical protein